MSPSGQMWAALHQSRLRRRLWLNTLGFLLGWLLIIGLLLSLGLRVHVHLPTFKIRGTSAPRQEAPAAGIATPPALVARLRALPSQPDDQPPLVLTYHGVEPDPRSPFAIAPRRLQQELALLRAAGYQTISAQRFLAWLAGHAALPRKAVLITFDDGLQATWRYADPILATLGQRATAFLITGHIGRGAFYLTSDEVRRMVSSGRWSFEAHTAHGHRYISTAPGRPAEPFLVGRRWLRQARPESDTEFARRVRADTAETLTWFAGHALPRPRLFAYPFSAAVSSDARASRISVAILSRAYTARFLDDSRGGMTTPQQRQQNLFRRLDVLGTYSPARFVDEIVAATPLQPAATRPLANGVWTRASGKGRVSVDRHGVALQPVDGAWVAAALAPSRTLAWHSYRISAHVWGLTDRVVAGVAAADSSSPVTVAVSRGWFEIRVGNQRKLVAQGRVVSRGDHWLRIDLRRRAATVAIDAMPVATVPVHSASGGPSLFVNAPPGSRVQFSEIRAR
jgi:poly-beta-1,6-N-acetyl-D-glucosamine N-deacetylase